MLTRFKSPNSAVSTTNMDLENGSRCLKSLMAGQLPALGCQKSAMDAVPWLPQSHDMIGQIGGRPF